MNTEFSQQFLSLLDAANQAADPQTNGLMDRTDYQATVAELVAAIRQLLEANEELMKERNALASRLSRATVPSSPQALGADVSGSTSRDLALKELLKPLRGNPKSSKQNRHFGLHITQLPPHAGLSVADRVNRVGQ